MFISYFEGPSICLILSVMVDISTFIGHTCSSGHSQQFFVREGKGADEGKHMKMRDGMAGQIEGQLSMSVQFRRCRAGK